MAAIKANSKDNFWKVLPIEKMQILDDAAAEEKPKNADFELAETKATKAIQKHSMNIDGRERNYQIDEAYLMLGKARYYDQRFYPALDAFNYILYKYPSSDKIYQAKIWREKTNMRLGNDTQVIKNISKLLDDKKREDKKKNGKKFKKQVIADANALLAASFLNMEEKDSAIVKLRVAAKFTRVNSERARYRFILGQLHQELGAKDSAVYYYQSVIDMNRRAERELLIHSYAKKAQLFDYKNGDRDAFVKRYNKLVDNRENRPFLDVIYYEMGVFYDKQKDQELAKEFYNASLKTNSQDSYLVASDYRNLGDMYFKNAEYSIAAKYYDSTLVKLDPKTREYIHIKKVRKDLDEVIEYEYVAKYNDSILNVVAMSDNDRILYFEKHIDKLKKSDENKKLLEEKQKEILANSAQNNINSDDDILPGGQNAGLPTKKPSITPPAPNTATKDANVFYFYNPNTVAFGKIEFKKKFGNRVLGGNWRSPGNKGIATGVNGVVSDSTSTDKIDDVKIVEEYTTDFYLKQLPKSQTEIDEIIKKRNFAYYQLGVIYKEKFKEYELATNKLEQLLTLNPEEKLILPTMYNLYKIYQITNSAKAEEMKSRILSQYPDSRYAQIINNVSPDSISSNETPDEVYDKLYKSYEEEQFVDVLAKLDSLIVQYAGDEIIPKFELLRANILGKLRGLEAYKNAMQFVADNYPTTEEGKNAQEILTTQIPTLEKMDFNFAEAKNWKILYKVGKIDDKSTKELEEKIKKFIATEGLSYTFDIYTEKDNFIAIHGLKFEAYAESIATVLKDNKEYKIVESAIIISNENYKIVQIKKNLEQYLVAPKVVPVPASVPQPIVPQQPANPIQDPVKPESIKQVAPQTMPQQAVPTGTKPPVGKHKSQPKP
ncbi:MAG: gliding motility protein [Bacteroidota bacterium]